MFNIDVKEHIKKSSASLNRKKCVKYLQYSQFCICLVSEIKVVKMCLSGTHYNAGISR